LFINNIIFLFWFSVGFAVPLLLTAHVCVKTPLGHPVNFRTFEVR